MRITVLFVLLSVLTASVTIAQAEIESYREARFHPFTMTAGDGCDDSGETLLSIDFRNCDPMNLLFDRMTLDEVVAALRRAGWSSAGFGSYQWTYFGAKIPAGHDRQMFLNLRPGEGGCPAEVNLCRYHVRLWTLPLWEGVIGAAHYEVGGAFVHDLAESWEHAESKACRDIDRLSGLRCRPNAQSLPEQASVQGGPTWRAGDGFSGLNNARISIIDDD